MSDINFERYGNEEFFQLFFTAVKETYGEYCTFKEKEENLSGYSEPMFEKSIEEAGIRLASVVQQLAKANERIVEFESEKHKDSLETISEYILEFMKANDIENFSTNRLSTNEGRQVELTIRYVDGETPADQLHKANERAHTCELEFERALDVAEECCMAKTREEACKILEEFKSNTSFEQTAESFAELKSRVKELEKRNNNQSKTIEAMEGCIASEVTKAFERAEIPLHAKAGCIGEFEFVIEDATCCPQCWEEQSDDCDMCNGKSDGSGLSDLTATVPWDLCKDIWLRMNQIYAEQLRKGGES